MLASHIHLPDSLEEIGGQAALLNHPVEEGIDGVQILVERFRPGTVSRAPLDEGVGIDIAGDLPSAIGEDPAGERADLLDVFFESSSSFEIGREFFEVIDERAVCRIVFELGREEASSLHLDFLDNLTQRFSAICLSEVSRATSVMAYSPSRR
ncbi:MAG: hypothetical protein AAF191_19750 [Verrucomicrobiota bacterium]